MHARMLAGLNISVGIAIHARKRRIQGSLKLLGIGGLGRNIQNAQHGTKRWGRNALVQMNGVG